MAKKPTEHFECSECGWTTTKWVGQCRECSAWGTLEQTQVLEAAPQAGGAKALTPSSPAAPISKVSAEVARYRSTGVSEFDRVLGGGIVPGAVVLLAGEPGVGKSTLLLDVAARSAADAVGSGPVLYISAEESASQIRLRAERIGALHDNLLLAAEANLETILGHVDSTNPCLLIVDSVQTIYTLDMEGSAGGVSQVRAVAARLIRAAKERNLPVILVGHVTKDGGIAGPRILEHLVDVVCQFEGDRHARLRLLRAVKNRYGPTDEVGCFDLRDSGIVGLPDPSGLFLSHTGTTTPGTCITVTLEGRRPMPTEVQALVAHTNAGSPRRTTSGIDHSRVAMMLAVCQARLGVDTSTTDVYVSTVGGAKTSEPAADMATALAIMSAAWNRPIKTELVAIGEVGLTGEIRATAGVQRRLTEAARLGFKQAIVPSTGSEDLKAVNGLTIYPVTDLATAAKVGLTPPDNTGRKRKE
ncbi:MULTISPECIES: DNA repair protein RadA [Actinomycetaceae]|uniref:DNA repair protein RadA n=1 Tax=Actinomycetaceae TaxID=2049 RepID=UPI001ED6A585|nr:MULTISPECIES: DNA repair protein RadA [Actinomycetaceae]MBS5825622.1 DNA repair protein RadA [Actinomyces sp.]MDP9835101.1 DNA repair protein RadA/Sms [Gleimia europaea]